MKIEAKKPVNWDKIKSGYEAQGFKLTEEGPGFSKFTRPQKQSIQNNIGGAGQVGQSFNKIVGSGLGAGGFYKDMSGLEGASMRLADAASRRKREEMELESRLGIQSARAAAQTQADIEAQAQGYANANERNRELQRKRKGLLGNLGY